MFTYCENNLINMFEPTGTRGEQIRAISNNLKLFPERAQATRQSEIPDKTKEISMI